MRGGGPFATEGIEMSVGVEGLSTVFAAEECKENSFFSVRFFVAVRGAVVAATPTSALASSFFFP